MKYFGIAVISLFCSCNTGEQTPPQGIILDEKQTVQQPEVPETQPYFSGHGSDSSWELSLDAKSDGSFPLKLNFKNGNEILSGNLQKEGLMKGNKPNVSTGEVKMSGVVSNGEKSENISISIVHQTCSDKDGKSHTHSLSFQRDGKTLKGCGDYAAD